jgi:hypothetical protein
MSIISISGVSRSGKDSAAAVLVKQHGFTQIALADPLRELCSRVFRLPFSDFEDQSKKDSPLDSRIVLDFHHIDKIREIIEQEWGFSITYEAREGMEEYHGYRFETPRDILKLVGTNLVREYIRDDIWIVLAFNKIAKIQGHVVVSDVRMKNEREAFANAGALMVLIKRPDLEDKEKHSTEDMGEDNQYDVIIHNTEEKHVFQNSVNVWIMSRKHDLVGNRKFKYEY